MSYGVAIADLPQLASEHLPKRGHSFCADVHHSFIVFNDDEALPITPVDTSDLLRVKAPRDCPLASMAWSSGVEYYFVVEPIGIYLFHIDGEGWFCRKRSAGFIKLFLDAPKGRRGR